MGYNLFILLKLQGLKKQKKLTHYEIIEYFSIEAALNFVFLHPLQKQSHL